MWTLWCTCKTFASVANNSQFQHSLSFKTLLAPEHWKKRGSDYLHSNVQGPRKPVESSDYAFYHFIFKFIKAYGKKRRTKGLQGIKQRGWNDLLLCLVVQNQFPNQEPDSDSTSRDSISI